MPAFETRYDTIRKALPPHSTYGYVSDNSIADPISQAEYYLTQYTLAPVIVKEDVDEPLEIGNMHNQHDVSKELAERHLVPVQDFGNGIKIYRNNYAK